MRLVTKSIQAMGKNTFLSVIAEAHTLHLAIWVGKYTGKHFGLIVVNHAIRKRIFLAQISAPAKISRGHRAISNSDSLCGST